MALELCIKDYIGLVNVDILYGQEIDIYSDKTAKYFAGRQDKHHVF